MKNLKFEHIIRTKDDSISAHVVCIDIDRENITIVATAKLTIQPQVGLLSELYVHSKYRSKGIGTTMQEYRENLAFHKFGLTHTYLSCKQHTPRHKRYLKRGYNVVIPNYKVGSDYMMKEFKN